MTRFNLPLKAAATLSALALTAVAAPSAFAGESTYSKVADRVAKKAQAQRQDRGSSANRTMRSDRSNRNIDRRSNRGTRMNERSRGTRDRVRSRNNSRDRNRQRDYVHIRNNRDYQPYRSTRRGYSTNYRPASFGNYRRANGYRHNGFNTNYRSGLGISFSFGSPGYSSYRWAPSNYGLYRPGRVSYASYRNRTRCDRVIVEGFHYGTLRPVSVKQCYNPWDGYYIIQGSERIARHHW